MNACFRGYHTKGDTKEEREQSRLAIVKVLLANGANPAYYTADTKLSATHWAAYNCDAPVVKELLSKGAPHFLFSHMQRLPIDVGGSSRGYDVVDVCLQNYYETVAKPDENMLQVEAQHATVEPPRVLSHNYLTSPDNEGMIAKPAEPNNARGMFNDPAKAY